MSPGFRCQRFPIAQEEVPSPGEQRRCLLMVALLCLVLGMPEELLCPGQIGVMWEGIISIEGREAEDRSRCGGGEHRPLTGMELRGGIRTRVRRGQRGTPW